jgi:hypothetical protein
MSIGSAHDNIDSIMLNGYKGTFLLTMEMFPEKRWSDDQGRQWTSNIKTRLEKDNGKWYLFPTMMGGLDLPEAGAYRGALKGKHFGVYDSYDEGMKADRVIHNHFEKIKGYQNGGTVEPASTNVHNNIDSLILQSEMDNRFYGKVGEFMGKKEYPINMFDYANLMSKADISGSTSKLGKFFGGLTEFVGEQDLKTARNRLLSKMRLGDSPGGMVAYRSSHPNENKRGTYFPAKNPLMAPDTIRLYQSHEPDKITVSSGLHEPLHSMDFSHGFKHLAGPSGKISHRELAGLRQKDFDLYEQNMIKSLSDYFGGEDIAMRKAMEALGHYPKPDTYNRYLSMMQGYEPMQDILEGYENGGVVQNLYSMI